MSTYDNQCKLKCDLKSLLCLEYEYHTFFMSERKGSAPAVSIDFVSRQEL